MAVTGTYQCACNKIFHGTFSDDEVVQCPDCKAEVPSAKSEPEFDFVWPREMEDIASIPFI
jgi:hypothetical protein